jgi:hypothetical protein
VHSIPDPRTAEQLRRLHSGDRQVEAAEYALRHFGGDMDAATAARMLDLWAHAGQLSDAQKRAVVAFFVPAEPLAEHMSGPGGSDTMREQAADRDLPELWRHEAEPVAESRRVIGDCRVCGEQVEYVTEDGGRRIADPYWRHVGPIPDPPHAAAPTNRRTSR